MTIHTLAQGLPTLTQYEIFIRADRLFPVGRYYGGTLTDAELATLTAGLNLEKS